MWPFPRNQKLESVKTDSGNKVLKSGDKFVRVISLDFFGPYSESPNKEFMIAWSDCDQERGIGGFRERGEGSYVLAQNGEVMRSGRLKRPNDGKIANNGTSIVNDWMFGEGLKAVSINKGINCDCPLWDKSCNSSHHETRSFLDSVA